MSRAVFAAAAILFAYYMVTAPGFLTADNAGNVAERSAYPIVLAVAQTMVIITAGIDLSVGAITAFAGSLAAVAFAYWGLSTWLAILLALLAGATLGAVNGLIITMLKIPDLIVTLGMMVTVRGIALLLTGGFPVPSHIRVTDIARAYLPREILWLGGGDIMGIPVALLVSLAIVGIGWVILTRTTLGRSFFAIGGNKMAAAVSGINVQRTKIMVYTLSGLLAAVAGVLLTGRMNSANALMAGGAELTSITAVVMGGTALFGGEGGVIGSLLGAIILSILVNVLNLHGVAAHAQQVLMGLLIIAVVVFDTLRRRYRR
jgi:ribose transport system permease protein